MDPANPNSVDSVQGNTHSGNLAGGAAPTLMNPVNDTMSDLSSTIIREQKGGAANQSNPADQMIEAIQKNSEGPAHVDLGGADSRPSDMTAQFDPKMDQETGLHTGKGDDMMIVV